jgi:integrase
MSVRKRVGRTGMAWVVDYRDGAGIRRNRQFATKTEASAFAAKTKIEVISGTHVPDSATVTVNEAADLWIARARQRNINWRTLAGYEEIVRLHITPFIGNVKLSRLSVPALNAFHDQLFASRRSADTVRRVLAALSSILNAAQRRGLVGFNNTTLIDRPKRNREARKSAMPTREELRAILAAAETLPERVLIMLALFAGLRASEIRGLTWANVDLKDGMLHVRQRADLLGGIDKPKSKAGMRSIPLSGMLLNTLKSWRLNCPISQLDLVLPTADGTVWNHMHLLRELFWPVLIRAGLGIERKRERAAKYGLHALRHAAAALWIAQGFNAKRIQTLMGHASIAMTYDVYGYLLEPDQEGERDAFDNLATGLVSERK